MDYELTLFDRIEVIKATNQKYDLEKNAYLSFSGGKDSTILHHLLDMALPNNNIPRVFIDTGIEFTMIRDFVLELAEKDKRFVILKPTRPIKQTLEKYGYPFKSKEHSRKVATYQNNGYCPSACLKAYANGGGEFINDKGEKKQTMFACPSVLRYQFTPENKIKISDKCCFKLKKEPAHKWQVANNKTIVLTGMRSEEGGARARLNCVVTNKEGKIVKFHPLVKVDEEWENEFISKNNVYICKIYQEPYNFKRTGCKGCPYALNLQHYLEVMEKYMPNERKQCEVIWKPIYEEYRRLGYRLKKVEEIKLL